MLRVTSWVAKRLKTLDIKEMRKYHENLKILQNDSLVASLPAKTKLGKNSSRQIKTIWLQLIKTMMLMDCS